jgi:transcriptional regulator with XRE-family HTH domain
MSSFRQLFDKAKQSDDFWIEKAILEFTSDIYSEMKRQGKTKADIARIIGSSPAHVSQIFNGNANFTIKSMVKLSRALNCRLHIKAVHDNKKLSFSHYPLKMSDKKPVIADSYVSFEDYIYGQTSIAA